MTAIRLLSEREAQRLAEVGLLSASLIHELRQPLFAARALTQLAQVASRPEQVAGHLDGVLAQLHTLEMLVLGYSEISRRPAADPVPFDVWTAIRSGLVIIEHRANAAGVVVVLGGESGALVRAPLLAVQQAVVNLCQNAIEALVGGEKPQLTITVMSSPVRVRVEDNGPGLDAEIRARLFEPFRTTKQGGTGLGLMLSRDLIEGFGGQLQLLDLPAGTGWEIAFSE